MAKLPLQSKITNCNLLQSTASKLSSCMARHRSPESSLHLNMQHAGQCPSTHARAATQHGHFKAVSYYYCDYYKGCKCCLMTLWEMVGCKTCKTGHWNLRHCDGADCCKVQPAVQVSQQAYVVRHCATPARWICMHVCLHVARVCLHVARVHELGYREWTWQPRPKKQRIAAPTNNFIPKGLPKPDHHQLIVQKMCIFCINAS